MDNVATRIVNQYLRKRQAERLAAHRISDAWAGDTLFDAQGRRSFTDVRPPAPVPGPTLYERVLGRINDQLSFARFKLSHSPHGQRGGNQGWQEVLEATIADGTAISNTTTETIIVPDFQVPANYMTPGRTLRLFAFGVTSNVVTTPGTLTIRVRWGGVAGVVLVASAAQGLDTTAHTNGLWGCLVYITCRTQGATGTFMSGGILWVFDLLSSTAANLLPALLGSAGTPGASGSAAVTVDTTVQKALSVTAQFSVATNPTNLTGQMRLVESLN